MKPVPQRRGVALVLILGVIVIITIMAVGLSAVMRTERAVAKNNLDSVQARAFAEMAVDDASGLIRQAIDAGSAGGRFWASQGGKITVFEADGAVNPTLSKNLYSVGSGTNTVNLNQTSFAGNSPIASAAAVNSGTAPALNVQWIDVLADPGSAASTNNQVVGRYAFWVDDETSKVNLNTADGGQKYSGTWFGSGQPGDVNLQALKSGGTGLTQAAADTIAQRTGMRPSTTLSVRALNSAEEVDGAGAGAGLFSANNFNVTHYNPAPELNIFGEPKIYLTTTFTSTSGGVGRVTNAMLGEYKYKGIGSPGEPTDPEGLPQKQVYPTDRQLPNFHGSGATMPQTFEYDRAMNNQIFGLNSADYYLGQRIAYYLSGTNGQGQGIQWPVFPGSSAEGFSGKYTPRQIDSIALQILSLMKRGTLTDHFRAGGLPYVLGKGWLSGKPVKGLSRMPKVNEVVLVFKTMAGSKTDPETGELHDIANLSIEMYVEWLLPKGLDGYPLAPPYDANGAGLWRYGYGDNRYYLNCLDAPIFLDDPDKKAASFATSETVDGVAKPWTTRSLAAAPLGGFWMDNLLRFSDQDGNPAGIDLFGNPNGLADPDPRAKDLHPYAKKTSGGKVVVGSDGKAVIYGTGPNSSSPAPVFRMNAAVATTADGWKVGEYHSTANFYKTTYYPSAPNVKELRVEGGLAIWVKSGGGTSYPDEGYNLDPVPLDSIRGPKYTGEVIANIRNDLLKAVIPMPAGLTIPVPGIVTVHLQVADPWVNSMPGDWVGDVSAAGITMNYPTSTSAPGVYQENVGQNTISKVTRGADPKSIWWPKQSAEITKSQRFPSSGFLQYIRTGMMPDKRVDKLSAELQHGVPFRMLNFASSNNPSQQTDGGESYPDWAMLDLFTVPAALQPLGSPAPPYLELTSGGATAGRINPNPPIIASGTVSRLLPMAAILKNNEVYIEERESPSPTVIDGEGVSSAIQSYLTSLGRPLMLPGEIANVPEVSQFLYQGVDATARSRNDLVRQIVGNLTTRSNTFTVWAVGQTVKKRSGNQAFGTVEATDTVTGESRMQFVIERYLDLGIDGVPGNSNNPGLDGVVGTPDDPVDPQYHPSMTYPLPYKYRVIFAKQVSN